MAYSQLFVLSFRGDVLLFKDFRGELPKSTAHVFYRRVKSPDEVLPPYFHYDGIQYLYVLHNGLFFVFTTLENASPAHAAELLHRISNVIRDFCGVLNEEAVRKNITMIYELIDEMMDYGYPITTSVTKLKSFVRKAPVLVDTEKRSEIVSTIVAASTTSSKTANRSVAIERKNTPDEIFIDIVEHLTMLFDIGGSIVHSEIEGELVCKSFIRGNPRICIGLNEDLRVGRNPDDGAPTFSQSIVDHMTFHPIANLTEWDLDRTIMFNPPEGEFTLFRYRVIGEVTPPFRAYCFIEEPALGQLDIVVKLQAQFPDENSSSMFLLSCPVPRDTSSASCELEHPNEHQYEWDEKRRCVRWFIKKMVGGTQTSIRIKVNIDKPGSGNYKREVSPISIQFEMPMFILSPVLMRYMRIYDGDKQIKPHRWVRSVTKTDSYDVRIDPAGLPNKFQSF